MFHEESFLDDDGIRTKRIMTSGKKLRKIVLETKIPMVFYTNTSSDENGDNKFTFETVKNNSSGKTPMGMFEDKEIPNDLLIIKKAINKYYGISELKKEKK